MGQDKLNEKLQKHKLWLEDSIRGKQLILNGADLRRVDLNGADLRKADLSGADLYRADLRWTDLSRADLSQANLGGANLRGADLLGADLLGADFSWATGNGRELKSIIIDTLVITYTKQDMAIGYEQYSIEDWFSFDDDRISEMDGHDLAWWRKYKDFIKSAINLSFDEEVAK